MLFAERCQSGQEFPRGPTMKAERHGEIVPADMTAANAPATLTTADLARELRVSVRQVRRLLSSGRLYPADLSLGGKRGRRWRRDRFEKWIRSGAPSADAWRSFQDQQTDRAG